MRVRYLPVLLVVVAFLAQGKDEAEMPAKYAAIFKEMWKRLDKADVRICRIDAHSGKPKEGEKQERVGGYVVLEEKACAAEDAAKLKDILAKPESYTNVFALCFEPGLAFRLKQDETTVDLVICLECHYVECSEGEAPRKRWPLSKASVDGLAKIYEAYFKKEEKKE